MKRGDGMITIRRKRENKRVESPFGHLSLNAILKKPHQPHGLPLP
jgi:hypothetical protein